MTRVSVGVVTVTFNSSSVLDDFLASLWAQEGVNVRLYSVDNDSQDSTVDRLTEESCHHPATVIANDANFGVAVGNNQGIEAALADGCDWVLLLNNDTMFSPTFIADLVRVANHRGLDIVSPLIEATEPPGSNWYSDGVIQPFKAMKTTHLGMGDPLLPASHPEVVAVDYASTCALLVRPVVFETVGLMDPIYFVYGDDVDFCIRAKRAGYHYTVTSSAVLTHKASSLTGEFTGAFASHWITRNWVVVARRHCSPLQLFVGSVYMAMWVVGRLVFRRESLSVTRRRINAVREGWRLDLRPEPPRLSITKVQVRTTKGEP
ncbi:glycosyltransferase family 2 protein [Sinomonas sp. ASV322]|uniref:glycosyltransferase family 2 protein n=1 Tax=Sinomonas sp. ASV322 TaxID=3041920 RepID=UPI0027DB9E34|nr:glycosyltransferase family 2 protein [Sinomonas sp. ASV322]MDQ4502979.1 glycosyltransferase family 2 protein [Sinomonas sp. ASV322]